MFQDDTPRVIIRTFVYCVEKGLGLGLGLGLGRARVRVWSRARVVRVA